MFGHKRKTIIIFIAILALLLIIFWKWPRPLSHYFETIEQPNVGTILLDDGQHTIKQVELKGKETLAPLWKEIQSTRVLHLNGYKTIDITDKTLYKVYLFNRNDGTSGEHGQYCFECDNAGFIYIKGFKYSIVGDSHLIPLLNQLCEEGGSELVVQ